MAKSRETYSKKEKEKKRLKKKQEKQQRKEERQENSLGSELGDMIAYVDENGNLTDTPPDPDKKKKIKAEDIVIGIPPKEKEDDSPLRTGRVEFFNHEKGYGFIKDTDKYEKYFVHVTGLVDEIDEGDLVTFELEQGPKGLNAVKVKK
ncbi:MAG: cold shock domain-containing protein [Bacteroidota bacterium]